LIVRTSKLRNGKIGKKKMAKKQMFLIIDTETTMEDHVYDFGAVLCDRHGTIESECSVILKDFANEPLFHDNQSTLWNLKLRQQKYANMLENGSIMVSSVQGVNRWLDRVIAKYPEVIAVSYNAAFDKDKLQKSGIDFSRFNEYLCLWQIAYGLHGQTKKYRQFTLENHYFNNVTDLGNATYQTNAEVMSHYVTGIKATEQHTALSDCKDFERHILVNVLKSKNWRKKMRPYNWRECQLKDAFIAK
jgi:hypothetical protein